VPAGACNPCIHISAAEVFAPMELLAARHERYSLLRYAGKSKDYALSDKLGFVGVMMIV